MYALFLIIQTSLSLLCNILRAALANSVSMVPDSPLGYRIISASAPWVAAEYSFDCKVQSFNWAVLLQCLQCVCGTCGGKSAAGRFERRNAYLVKSYQSNQWDGKGFFKNLSETLLHQYFRLWEFLLLRFPMIFFQVYP